MASIGNDSNQRKRILFVYGDGRRKTIRLGKATQKQAAAFKLKVESLITGAITGSIDDETARWLAGLEEFMYGRLVAVGLAKPRQVNRVTLEEFVDAFIAGRSDVKPATILVFGHTIRNLVEYFGGGKSIAAITEGDADNWRLSLTAAKLSNTTIRRRCGIAKQIFRSAVRQKFIPANPFADLKASGLSNPHRSYFITRLDAQKVSEACPNAEWRLLFALSRYGGLRCPSEHLALRWEDVNWELGRLTVRSPKTEHHVGGDCRVIPIFPELLTPLRECFELAEPGAIYIITNYRDTNSNLRTQMQRIITRAGVKPWPKLFHNLRASRETELADMWPEHVVCKWLGNSRVVARRHYLQVTDEHFAKAAAGESAAQNPAQQGAESARTGPQFDTLINAKRPVLPGVATQCQPMQGGGMGGTGLEPATPSVSCWCSSQLS